VTTKDPNSSPEAPTIRESNGRITITNNDPSRDILAIGFYYLVNGARRYYNPAMNMYEGDAPFVKAGSFTSNPTHKLKPGEDLLLTFEIDGVLFSDGSVEGPNKRQIELSFKMRNEIYHGQVAHFTSEAERGDSHYIFSLLSRMYRAMVSDTLPIQSERIEPEPRVPVECVHEVERSAE